MTSILCLGSNFFGQLGIDDEIRPKNRIYEPILFSKSSKYTTNTKDFKDIQCGSQFTAVLSMDGKISLCGSMNGTIFPFLYRIEVPYPLKCTAIACGRKHILALMEGGYVLSWGTGHFGQLGHGDDSSLDIPKMIHSLEPRAIGTKIVEVLCGGSHSGAISENGILFMWGLNKSGQCGIVSNTECILDPKKVEYMDNSSSNKPLSVVCGRNHSAMLTSNGKLYAWGSASYGRLGIPTDSRKFIPTPAEVTFFQNIPLHSVASGDFHMLALSHDCSVYSWGYGADGQLGHGSLHHCRTPRRIDYFDSSIQITEICCGAWWSMAVSRVGCLYAWGYADGGCLGISKPSHNLLYIESDTTTPGGGSTTMTTITATATATATATTTTMSQTFKSNNDHIYACQTFDSSYNILRPQRVRTLSKYIVNSVRCGGAHIIAICTNRSDLDPDDYSSNDDDDDDDDNNNSNNASRKVAMEIESRKPDIHDMTSQEMTTQLFAWSRHRKFHDLEYALQKGADVNTRDTLGNTPLIVACQNGHLMIATLLINHGADVTAKNKTGNTALHYCFAFGFDELGQYLISKGADEFAINNEGMTCYEGLDREDMDRSWS